MDAGTPTASPERVTELTRVLSTMRFVTSFAFGCAGTVRILHMDVLSLDVRSIGTIMAVYSVVIALVEVPSGAVSDVWGRRKTKLLASWVMAGAYLTLATADGLVDVAMASGVLAVGRALYSGAADSWFVDEVGDASDPRVLRGLARSEAAHNAGTGLGALCGATLPQLYADSVAEAMIFAPVFALGAFFLVIDMGLTWRFMIENRPLSSYPVGGVWPTTLAGVSNALEAGPSRWIAVAMGVVGGSVACIELLTPLSIANGLGTERALIVFGPLVAASWLFSAGASLVTERFTNLVGSLQRSNAILMVAVGVTLVPVGLDTWWAAAISFAGVNFVLGALVPLLRTMLHQRVRSSNRSAASSTTQLALMAGAAITAGLIGLIGGLTVVIVGAGAAVTAVAFFVLTEPNDEVLDER